MIGIANSGAAGRGVDGDVIGGVTNLDLLALGYDLGSGLSLDASYWEDNQKDAAGKIVGTDVIGIGKGAESGLPAWAIGGTYASGPLKARLLYTTWTREANGLKNRVSIMGAYDLGVARISAGYSDIKEVGTTTKETLLGLKVPAGALTFGLDYAILDKEAANSDKTGFSLGVQYDLSKRSHVNASFWSNKKENADKETNGARLRLTHNF